MWSFFQTVGLHMLCHRCIECGPIFIVLISGRARLLSGRMPDSQSSEPGFESLFATVSEIGHFRSLNWRPCSLSCINEYLATDRGGNVCDLALARNCCLARMLPGEAELVSEWTGLPGEAICVKRFERSNGRDTALYKNYLFLDPTSSAVKVGFQPSRRK